MFLLININIGEGSLLRFQCQLSEGGKITQLHLPALQPHQTFLLQPGKEPTEGFAPEAEETGHVVAADHHVEGAAIAGNLCLPTGKIQQESHQLLLGILARYQHIDLLLQVVVLATEQLDDIALHGRNQLAAGLQQLMAGARKFTLKEISRNELFSANKETVEVTGIPFITDVLDDKAKKILKG